MDRKGAGILVENFDKKENIKAVPISPLNDFRSMFSIYDVWFLMDIITVLIILKFLHNYLKYLNSDHKLGFF